jgi:hypothetical protein
MFLFLVARLAGEILSRRYPWHFKASRRFERAGRAPMRPRIFKHRPCYLAAINATVFAWWPQADQFTVSRKVGLRVNSGSGIGG